MLFVKILLVMLIVNVQKIVTINLKIIEKEEIVVSYLCVFKGYILETSYVFLGEPIKFECLGTRASVSLHTKYWYDKFIDVKDVFVNDGCAGDEDGDWYVFDCAGKVTVSIQQNYF